MFGLPFHIAARRKMKSGQNLKYGRNREVGTDAKAMGVSAAYWLTPHGLLNLCPATRTTQPQDLCTGNPALVGDDPTGVLTLFSGPIRPLTLPPWSSAPS